MGGETNPFANVGSLDEAQGVLNQLRQQQQWREQRQRLLPPTPGLEPPPELLGAAAGDASEKFVSEMKGFEGFRSQAYHNPEDPEGTWTLGFGRTTGVKQGDASTLGEEDRRLRTALGDLRQHIRQLVTVPISERQLDALVSLSYNTGIENFSKSTLLQKINRNDPTAADEFDRWIKAAGVPRSDLVKRRSIEKSWFKEGSKQQAPAPAPAPAAPLTPPPVPTRTAEMQDQFMAVPNPPGLVERGNIPIWDRPVIQNAPDAKHPQGSRSSEYSKSFADEKGVEVLVPTIVNGKFLTPDGKKPPEGSQAESEMFERAWKRYEDTGENLGKFQTAEAADAYAQQLHNRQDRRAEAAPRPKTAAEIQAEQEAANPFTKVTSLDEAQAVLKQLKKAPAPFIPQQVTTPTWKYERTTVSPWTGFREAEKEAGEYIAGPFARRVTLSDQEVKDKIEQAHPITRTFWYYALGGPGPYPAPYIDTPEQRAQTIRRMQIEQRVLRGVYRTAGEFISDPVNLAFMAVGGPLAEYLPLVSFSISTLFLGQMVLGNVVNTQNVRDRGKAINWDIMPGINPDGSLQIKPGQNEFWQAAADLGSSVFWTILGAFHLIKEVRGRPWEERETPPPPPVAAQPSDPAYQAAVHHLMDHYDDAARKMYGKPFMLLDPEERIGVIRRAMQVSHAAASRPSWIEEALSGTPGSATAPRWSDVAAKFGFTVPRPGEDSVILYLNWARKYAMVGEPSSFAEAQQQYEDATKKVSLSVEKRQRLEEQIRDLDQRMEGENLKLHRPEELEAPPIVGAMGVAKTQKIIVPYSEGPRVGEELVTPEFAIESPWGAEVAGRPAYRAGYEKEVTVWEPDVTHGLGDVAALTPEQREFARQKFREQNARIVLEHERQRQQAEQLRRMRETADEWRQLDRRAADAAKRVADLAQKAREEALKIIERRGLRFPYWEFERIGEVLDYYDQELLNRAYAAHFVTPEEYEAHLKGPRDRAYTKDENDFLEMMGEKRTLEPYRDPSKWPIIGLEPEPPTEVGPPRTDVMRDRLTRVTTAEEARQVLDGADDDQLLDLMLPMNQGVDRSKSQLYARAGQRPLFTDRRGNLREGSPWGAPLQGVTVVATMPVHPDDVPSWATPGPTRPPEAAPTPHGAGYQETLGSTAGQGYWYDKHTVIEGQDSYDAEPAIQKLMAQGMTRPDAYQAVLNHALQTGRELLADREQDDILVEPNVGRWQVDRRYDRGYLVLLHEDGTPSTSIAALDSTDAARIAANARLERAEGALEPPPAPAAAAQGPDQFILQVSKEGSGNLGAAAYVAPDIVVGRVDPTAPRRNWDWNDWAAGEFNRRLEEYLNALGLVEQQHKLVDAADDLSNQAANAPNAEEADHLAEDAEEARRMAKDIEDKRIQKQKDDALKKPAIRESYPVRQWIPEIARGSDSEMLLPSGRKVQGHYALVAGRFLIGSHLPLENFQPNPDYIWFDAEMTDSPQQWDYFRNETRRDLVKYRAANPELASIYNTSPRPNDGVSRARADGILLSGNNRHFIHQIMYQDGRGQQILDMIEATKSHFGIDAPTPDISEKPEIVWISDEPIQSRKDLIDVGHEANRPSGTKADVSEEARALAQRFTDDFKDWIVAAFDAMDDDATLRSFMTKYSEELVKRLESDNWFSPNERSEWIQKGPNDKDELTPAAKLHFENAVRGAVIRDGRALQALQSPGMRAMGQTIDRALPGLLQMVAKNGIYDISDYLKNAINEYSKIIDEQKNIDDRVGIAKDEAKRNGVPQKDIDRISRVDGLLYPDKLMGYTPPLVEGVPPPPEVDKITESLMRLIELKSGEIRKAIQGYADDAVGRQGEMFAPPPPWESFTTNIAGRFGIELTEGEWGRLVREREAKPPQGEVPPRVEEQPPPPEEPPAPPPAVGAEPTAPLEAPPEGVEEPTMTEARMREIVAQHPGIAPQEREDVISIWRTWAEKYWKVPLDKFLSRIFKRLEVGGVWKPGTTGLFQVDTEQPSFRSWFGNSKVVDEAGQPRMMVHGTASRINFDVFATRAAIELGSHFGTVAQGRDRLLSEQEYVPGTMPFPPGSRMLPVYLRIENPLRLVDRGSFAPSDVIPQLVKQRILSVKEGKEWFDDWYDDLAESAGANIGVVNDLQHRLRERGYDGIVYLNRREGFKQAVTEWGLDDRLSDEEFKAKYPLADDSYIVFRPEQVKSAIANVGEFDPRAPSILFQRDVGREGRIRAQMQRRRKLITKKYRDLLTGKELDDLTKTTKVAAEVSGIIRKLPAVREWEEAAKAGAVARRWYEKAAAAFESLSEVAPNIFHPEDKQRFLDFIAAISPQQEVKLNLQMALEHWGKWIEAGRPLDDRRLTRLFRTLGLEARIPNAIRAIRGENLSGYKVTSFGKALYGMHGWVPNDVWMALFGDVPQGKLDQAKFYHAMSVRSRQAAERLGWHDEEAQAAIWSFIKALIETTGARTNYDPEEALKNLTNEDIAQRMADMSVLMRDEDIQGTLQALGVNTDALNEKLQANEERFAQISPQEPYGIQIADPVVLRRIARRLRRAELRRAAEQAARTGEAAPTERRVKRALYQRDLEPPEDAAKAAERDREAPPALTKLLITPDGRVKMDADAQSLAGILGGSLYDAGAHKVVTKETLQNAWDAIRLSTGEKKVTVHLHTKENSLEVTDTGPGMTREELGTVFVDIARSGKREQAEAAGGFGIGNVPSLVSTQRLEVRSVTEEPVSPTAPPKGFLARFRAPAPAGPTRKMEHTLISTPEQILGPGVEIKSREVPLETPTGTTVKAFFDPQKQKIHDAWSFLSDSRHSIRPPGELVLLEDGKKPWWDAGPAEQLEPTPIAQGTFPAATASIYVSQKTPGIAEAISSAFGYVPLEVNNNGIYQFTSYISAPRLRGAPKRVAVDVKPTVMEGSPDYPFKADRESLREELRNQVEELFRDAVLRPLYEKDKELTGEIYRSLPTMTTHTGGSIVLLDSGGRLTPEELQELQNNPALKEIGGIVQNFVHEVIGKAQRSNLPVVTDIGKRVERVGLFFADKVHGLHLTNPADESKTTLFINPLQGIMESTPDEFASLIWHAIKHELVHEVAGDHDEKFAAVEAQLSRAVGWRDEAAAMEAIHGAYTRGGDPNVIRGLRPELNRAIQIYGDSRARPEVTPDLLGGTALREGRSDVTRGEEPDVEELRDRQEQTRVLESAPGPLFQKEAPPTKGQPAVTRGVTRFVEGGKVVMRLYDPADVSTFLEESLHAVRPYLKPEDLAILEKRLGIENGVWEVEHEEKLANWWKRWLRDGIAPSPELKALFARIKAAMLAIYETLTSRRARGMREAGPVPTDVSGVFRRMMTGEALEAPPVEGTPVAKTEAPTVEKPVEAGEKPTLVPPPSPETVPPEAEVTFRGAADPHTLGEPVITQAFATEEAAIQWAIDNADNFKGLLIHKTPDGRSWVEYVPQAPMPPPAVEPPPVEPAPPPPVKGVKKPKATTGVAYVDPLTETPELSRLFDLAKEREGEGAGTSYAAQIQRRVINAALDDFETMEEAKEAAREGRTITTSEGWEVSPNELEAIIKLAETRSYLSPWPPYHSTYLYTLNNQVPRESAFRVPTPGESTVADLIKPGDIIATNYGSLVHVVDSVDPYVTFGHTSHSITMHQYGEKPRKGQESRINELVAIDGVIRGLLKANDDTVFKISEADAKRVKAGEITPQETTPIGAPPEVTEKLPVAPIEAPPEERPVILEGEAGADIIGFLEEYATRQELKRMGEEIGKLMHWPAKTVREFVEDPIEILHREHHDEEWSDEVKGIINKAFEKFMAEEARRQGIEPPSPEEREIEPPPPGTQLAERRVQPPEDINFLPPVKKGKKRLYRGQSGKKASLPEWLKEGLKESGALDATGLWWTDDPSIAMWYVQDAGEGGELVYRDVDATDAHLAKVSNLAKDYKLKHGKRTVQSFSLDPENEYFLLSTEDSPIHRVSEEAAKERERQAAARPIEPPPAPAAEKAREIAREIGERQRKALTALQEYQDEAGRLDARVERLEQKIRELEENIRKTKDKKKRALLERDLGDWYKTLNAHKAMRQQLEPPPPAEAAPAPAAPPRRRAGELAAPEATLESKKQQFIEAFARNSVRLKGKPELDWKGMGEDIWESDFVRANVNINSPVIRRTLKDLGIEVSTPTKTKQAILDWIKEEPRPEAAAPEEPRTIELDPKRFHGTDGIDKSYSSDTVPNGKIRGVVTIEGKRYVDMGGAGGEGRKLNRLFTPEEWGDRPIYTYSEKTRLQGPPERLYEGIEVMKGKTRYIMGDWPENEIEVFPKGKAPKEPVKPPPPPGQRTLFQADSPTAREIKIGLIRRRLEMNPTPEMRRVLERALAELTGVQPPLEAPPAAAPPPKATPPPVEKKPPVEKPAAPPPKVEAKPRTVKIWTPDGVIEVTVPPEAEGGGRAEEPKPGPAIRPGRTPDDIVRKEKPPRADRVPEQPRPPAPGEEPTPGPSVPPRRAGGEGRGRDKEPRGPLPDVKPARVDAPKRHRGAPLYPDDEWKQMVADLWLSKGTPVPYIKLDPDLRAQLIYPGQPEIEEVILSGLDQHDGFILSTPTGSGKTYWAAATIAQMKRLRSLDHVLFISANDKLVQKFKTVAREQFDLDVKDFPPGMSVPDKPGVYAITYDTMRMRDGMESFPWDFVAADEIANARRWFSSQRGAKMKTLAENAKKVLYMSATPYHTALELGHMGALGLWRSEGFESWAYQFGVRKDRNGKLFGGDAPKLLVKLRQQLIERGQFIEQKKDLSTYHAHFVLVPLTKEQKQGLRNIVQAFDLAKHYYLTVRHNRAKANSMEGIKVNFLKSYLERSRLPQVIEFAKKADAEGYKMPFMSEHFAGRDELFDSLKEPDQYFGGEISQLMPPLPDVFQELRKAFGDQLANFSGKASPARDLEPDFFQKRERKHIFASYAAGGQGIDLHDISPGGKYPRLANYLGLPWSGIMFDQAVGRPLRNGSTSAVHAYFFLSDTVDEVNLVLKKILPRLESLKAVVSGVDMTDPMTIAMRKVAGADEGALGYGELGNQHESDADDLATTWGDRNPKDRHIPVENYANLKVPPIADSIDKPMRYPGQVQQHPGITRLYQREDEIFPSKEELLPEEFEVPDETEASVINKEIADDYANGQGAPGTTPEELAEIPALQRGQIAEIAETVARSDLADDQEHTKEVRGNPQAIVRRAHENNAKWTSAIMKTLKGTPFYRAGRALQLSLITSGRTIVRIRADEAGAPKGLGTELSQLPAHYMARWGLFAGPYHERYADLLAKYKLTPEEFDNMFLVKEGATRRTVRTDPNSPKVPVQPLNDRVAAAARDMNQLTNDMWDDLAKAGIYMLLPDENGKPRPVYYKDMRYKPTWMPHMYDLDRDILYTTEENVIDGNTGQTRTVLNEESIPFRELLKGKELGEPRYDRIVKSIARERGWSKAQVEDWLKKYRERRTPLAGNIEKPRMEDLPFYRTDKDVFTQYIDEFGEVMARAKVYGQERQKLERKILEVPDVTAREAINEAFDTQLARRFWEQDTKYLMALAGDYTVITKMWASSAKIPFHPIHSTLILGNQSLLKALYEFQSDRHEAMRWARYIGAVVPQLEANLRYELAITSRRGAEGLLKYNGFYNAYNVGRAISAAGGRIWMEDVALPGLLERKRADYIRHQLKDEFLFSDEQINRAIENKRWTPDDLAWGGKVMSDRIMYTADPMESPVWWHERTGKPLADNFMAAAQITRLLQSFTFKTSKLLKDRLFEEAVRHRNFRPFFPLLVVYPLIGELMQQISDIATFKDPKKIVANLPWKWWLDPKHRTLAQLLGRYLSDIAHPIAWTSMVMTAGAYSGSEAMLRWTERLIGAPYEDVLRWFIGLPVSLKLAKTDYARRAAIERALESTFTPARALIKLEHYLEGYDPEAEKKKAQSHRGTSRGGKSPYLGTPQPL